MATKFPKLPLPGKKGGETKKLPPAKGGKVTPKLPSGGGGKPTSGRGGTSPTRTRR